MKAREHWSKHVLDLFEKRTGRRPVLPSMLLKVKPSKYNNRKVEVDGIKFDSSKEANRYLQLKTMVYAGIIHSLELQKAFVLAPAVRLKGEKRTKPALRYLADFVYCFSLQPGGLTVEDVKSDATRKKEAYRIKKHLMATVHNIHITEI